MLAYDGEFTEGEKGLLRQYVGKVSFYMTNVEAGAFYIKYYAYTYTLTTHIMLLPSLICSALYWCKIAHANLTEISK